VHFPEKILKCKPFDKPYLSIINPYNSELMLRDRFLREITPLDSAEHTVKIICRNLTDYHPYLVSVLVDYTLNPILFHYVLQSSPLISCYVAVHQGIIYFVMIPPYQWQMNVLFHDSRNDAHIGTQAQPVPIHGRHSTFATTQLATIAYISKSPVEPIHLDSTSDIPNWFVDTGNNDHMTPRIRNLVHVEAPSPDPFNSEHISTDLIKADACSKFSVSKV
jgi:hypothetical protein